MSNAQNQMPNGNSSKTQRLEAVSDLVLIAGLMRPRTVIIPGGDREDDLRLVESARDHGIVDRCLLVGDETAIRKAASQVGINVAAEDILATASPQETAQRTVECVQQGKADVILKGNISTPILNRAMVRIAVRETMSLVTIFDAAPIRGGRPLIMTDAGVTTVCSFGRMVGLIENAVDVARSVMALERPRVAVLSANEKYIESLPSTRMGRKLSEYPWDNAVVYGPLSFDLAVSEESVRLKGVPGKGAALEVAGQADILVSPSLDAANILYKVIGEMVKYGIGTFAGVAVGVAVPYVILSRGDNVETKLQSIALSSIVSERIDMRRRPRATLVTVTAPIPRQGQPSVESLAAIASSAATIAERMSLPLKHTCYVVAHLAEECTVAAVREGAIVDSEVVSCAEQAAVHALLGEIRKGLEAGNETSSRAAPPPPGPLPQGDRENVSAGLRPLLDRIAKSIGALCVPAGPDVEGILLCGELSRSELLVRGLRTRLAHILPVSTVRLAASDKRGVKRET